MDPDDFKRHLRLLGLTQARAAEFLGYHRVTVNKWAGGEDPVPLVVARLLSLMVSRRIRPDEVGP